MDFENSPESMRSAFPWAFWSRTRPLSGETTDEERALVRLATDYIGIPLLLGAPFTVSDAISVEYLLRLHSEDPGRSDQRPYYLNLLTALTRALRLPPPPEFTGCLAVSAAGVAQALRLRRHAIAFQDECGEVLDGPRWAPGASEAQGWYLRAASALLAGVPALDRVICEQLGWDPSRQVAWSELRHADGTPDLEEEPPEFAP